MLAIKYFVAPVSIIIPQKHNKSQRELVRYTSQLLQSLQCFPSNTAISLYLKLLFSSSRTRELAILFNIKLKLLPRLPSFNRAGATLPTVDRSLQLWSLLELVFFLLVAGVRARSLRVLRRSLSSSSQLTKTKLLKAGPRSSLLFLLFLKSAINCFITSAKLAEPKYLCLFIIINLALESFYSCLLCFYKQQLGFL